CKVGTSPWMTSQLLLRRFQRRKIILFVTLWGLRAPHPEDREFRPLGREVSRGLPAPEPPQFRSCGGCPPPRPGEGRFRAPARGTFSTWKKYPKRRRGHPGPRLFI